MKITGSICKVAGERVAVVAVQRSVLDHSVEADRYITGDFVEHWR